MKLFDLDSLPDPLRPLSKRTLVIGIACLLAALMLTACGGGQADDPEQRKDDPSPNCAMRPEVCK